MPCRKRSARHAESGRHHSARRQRADAPCASCAPLSDGCVLSPDGIPPALRDRSVQARANGSRHACPCRFPRGIQPYAGGPSGRVLCCQLWYLRPVRRGPTPMRCRDGVWYGRRTACRARSLPLASSPPPRDRLCPCLYGAPSPPRGRWGHSAGRPSNAMPVR